MIKLFDVVALTLDSPEHGLQRGQVGTIVKALGPGAFEVEFSDDEGHSYASLGIPAEKLIGLHCEPVAA